MTDFVYGLRHSGLPSDRTITVRLPPDLSPDFADEKALHAALCGKRVQLTFTGEYDGTSASYVADSVHVRPLEDAIDEMWCPLIVEALKHHLETGDPQEAMYCGGDIGALTAQRVLEMLLAKDPKALRFVEEVHTAALYAVRSRKRDPDKTVR